MVKINKFDTEFDAKLHRLTSGNSRWQSLEINIAQLTDNCTSTKIIFNTITKQDLLNLSEMFRDLAGQYDLIT